MLDSLSYDSVPLLSAKETVACSTHLVPLCSVAVYGDPSPSLALTFFPTPSSLGHRICPRIFEEYHSSTMPRESWDVAETVDPITLGYKSRRPGELHGGGRSRRDPPGQAGRTSGNRSDNTEPNEDTERRSDQALVSCVESAQSGPISWLAWKHRISSRSWGC